jgi:hypothetical protein
VVPDSTAAVAGLRLGISLDTHEAQVRGRVRAYMCFLYSLGISLDTHEAQVRGRVRAYMCFLYSLGISLDTHEAQVPLSSLQLSHDSAPDMYRYMTDI